MGTVELVDLSSSKVTEKVGKVIVDVRSGLLS